MHNLIYLVVYVHLVMFDLGVSILNPTRDLLISDPNMAYF